MFFFVGKEINVFYLYISQKKTQTEFIQSVKNILLILIFFN